MVSEHRLHKRRSFLRLTVRSSYFGFACKCATMRRGIARRVQTSWVDDGARDWSLYAAQVQPDAAVTLDDEHDRYEWVSVDVACSRCAPAKVAAQLRSVMAFVSTRQ